MTDRIYFTDAYTTTFAARVTERSGDGTRIELDRTAFYPTSGGQLHDVGTLNGVPVVDVVDEGGAIVHLLAAPLPHGDSVEGVIEWERRFDHMQQHTGQHLISALFADILGATTASVHFGAEYSSVDLDADEIARAALLRIEDEANRIVRENVRVSVSFEDASRASGLRKGAPRTGELRIVTIDGVDRSACGGTHVSGTAQIGPVLLGRTDRAHGKVRLEFLCGSRVLKRAHHDSELLSATAALLGVRTVEVPERVAALGSELRTSERSLKRALDELGELRVERMYSAAQPDSRGVRWLIERRAGGTLDDIRPLALAATALPGAAFVGLIADTSQVILSASEDSGLQAGAVLRSALAAVGGRGGGSPRLAQGSAREQEFDTLLRLLTSDA